MARPDPTPAHFFGGTNMRFFVCPGPTDSTVTVSAAGWTPSPDDQLKQCVAYLNSAATVTTVIDLISSGAELSTGILKVLGNSTDYSGYTVQGWAADKDAT